MTIGYIFSMLIEPQGLWHLILTYWNSKKAKILLFSQNLMAKDLMAEIDDI